MKKFSPFFVSVLCTIVLPAFGQLSNPEILDMIRMSKEYNQQYAGVSDPNLIFPGQALTYFFRDGATEVITVEPGDNQWVIARDKLLKLREKHGEVVVDPVQQVQPEPHPFTEPEPFPWWANVPWGWMLAAFCVLIILVKVLTMINWRKLSEKRRGKFSSSPANEGRPFVPGGVVLGNSEKHFVNLAHRNNPGASIQVTNRRRGYLSTVGGSTVTVEFGDKTKQKLSFRNEPAFAAMVSVNGKPAKEEFFFQACGNPVYSRRSMKAGKNLIFTTEPIVFGDEPATTVAPATETTMQKTESQTPAVVVEPVMPEVHRSEYDTQTERAMILAKEVLGKDDPHEVTIEIPKGNDGIFKVVIKTQYPKRKRSSRSHSS